MSSLWTPSGEHKVHRPNSAAESSAEPSNNQPATDDFDEQIAAVLPEGTKLEDLTDEQRESAKQALIEMAETRERLVNTPAEILVVNHAMGLYELAALHLSTDPANFESAKLSIDAMNAIVSGLEGRLGEAEATVVQARDQIRLAFVQTKQASQQGSQ